MSTSLKVLVLAGGPDRERQVSLQSGKTIAGAIAPQLVRATIKNANVILTFNTFGSTLKLRNDPVPNKAGYGFEVAGADGKFQPATARVGSGQSVVLTCKAVTAPVAVRYAWHMWPTVTLFNERGIPAEPFNVTVK